MKDKSTQHLDLYLAGLIKMVDEATTGANVHEAANIKTSFILAQGILRRDDQENVNVQKLKQSLQSSIARAKNLWWRWYETTGRKKYEMVIVLIKRDD